MARCGGGRGRGLNYFIIIAIITLAIRGVTKRAGEARPHIVTSSSGARKGEARRENIETRSHRSQLVASLSEEEI